MTRTPNDHHPHGDGRLREGDDVSPSERVCRGCEQNIPWDWVFCAWCGEENDRVKTVTRTSEQFRCRPCGGGGKQWKDGQQTDKSCPDCGGNGWVPGCPHEKNAPNLFMVFKCVLPAGHTGEHRY